MGGSKREVPQLLRAGTVSCSPLQPPDLPEQESARRGLYNYHRGLNYQDKLVLVRSLSDENLNSRFSS